MIKNKRKLTRFYEETIKKERLSFKQALSLYEALHQEAVSLGVINSKNILGGLEVDFRIARIIHGLKSD